MVLLSTSSSIAIFFMDLVGSFRILDLRALIKALVCFLLIPPLPDFLIIVLVITILFFTL
uniref:Uncharacterized protein n=1 Tax=Octopus bimaculoides TaxID=37653 RepID=A0A0L8GYN6_OCTBM